MAYIEALRIRAIKPDEIISGYPVFNDPARAEAYCERVRNSGNAIAFVSRLSQFVDTNDNRAIVVNSGIE